MEDDCHPQLAVFLYIIVAVKLKYEKKWVNLCYKGKTVFMCLRCKSLQHLVVTLPCLLALIVFEMVDNWRQLDQEL